MRSERSAVDASGPVELAAVLAAERTRLPFLIVREPEGAQRLVLLEPDDERLWIGREPGCGIAFPDDAGVSRVHAELVRVADRWAIVDDGLSRNGTRVEGARVGAGRRPLRDGETVRLGSHSSFVYREPGAPAAATAPTELPSVPELTTMQRRVLAELCAPLRDGRQPAAPATNPEIAAALVLSEEAIKTHVRALFAKFALGDLPRVSKRMRLAELAILTGVGGPFGDG